MYQASIIWLHKYLWKYKNKQTILLVILTLKPNF